MSHKQGLNPQHIVVTEKRSTCSVAIVMQIPREVKRVLVSTNSKVQASLYMMALESMSIC